MIDTQHWQHVFKLDPDKTLSDEDLEAICESGTDAIIVGGTYGVTFENTIDLLGRVRRYATPCVLEVSNAQSIVPGFDHYFIPLVLNATNSEWILKPHHKVVKEFGRLIPWQDVSMVGYCILNAEASVAQLTKSDTDLQIEDIVAYGQMALHMFQLPFFYLEYSGSYADPNKVEQVHQAFQDEPDIHLFYGGGISGPKQAQRMSQHAHTIVVGNAIYDDLQAALQTVPINI